MCKRRREKLIKMLEFFLKQNKEVLFTGTPCQIAGLRRFLGKDYENLLTVDFACHGVPSPGVWQRYLGELGIKLFANKVSVEKGMKSISPFKGKISNIEFRNKTLNGWKNTLLWSAEKQLMRMVRM